MKGTKSLSTTKHLIAPWSLLQLPRLLGRRMSRAVMRGSASEMVQCDVLELEVESCVADSPLVDRQLGLMALNSRLKAERSVCIVVCAASSSVAEGTILDLGCSWSGRMVALYKVGVTNAER